MLITGIKSKPVYAPLAADTGGRYHLMLASGPGLRPVLRVLDELKAAAPQALAHTRVLLVAATPHGAASDAAALDAAALDAAASDPAASDPAASDPAALDAATSDAAASDPAASDPAVLDAATADAATADAATADAAALDAAALDAALERFDLAGVNRFDDAGALLTAFRRVLEESLMGTRLYVAGPESFIGLAMKLALEFDLNKDEIRAEEIGSRARRVYCVHCRDAAEDVRTNIVRCPGCGRWLLVRDHYSRRLAAYMGVMVDAEVPGEIPTIREIYP